MIYLDNSATTALSETVRARLAEGYEKFANPSSLHLAGLEASKLIEKARGEILSAMNVKNASAYRVIFTSSGSEADNLALFGIYRAKKFRFTPKIITTDSEHPAILEALSRLNFEGAEVVKLSTKGGIIDKDELRANIDERVILISIMAVNNETGAKYDIPSLFSLAKRLNPDIITHTDCVQGFCKVPFSLPLSKADLVTISGHKIHAPKGVGALVVSEPLLRSKRIVPLIYGGGQEGGIRSGTENTAGIYALGGAALEGAQKLTEFAENAARCRKAFEAAIGNEARVNTPIGDFSPHIISLTLPSIRSETMLHFLSAKGIFVSSGSACSSNGKHKNYVLSAFGLTPSEIDSTIRISLSVNSTETELAECASAIKEGIRSLVKSK